jgi:hypothetical protein
MEDLVVAGQARGLRGPGRGAAGGLTALFLAAAVFQLRLSYVAL